MLATSNSRIKDLEREKIFLTGNIFYLPIVLRQCNSQPEVIEDACNQIISYLSEILECVNSEEEIMQAINTYLYHLIHNTKAFREFDNSPEYELFKDIFTLFEQTYLKRVSEYLWYIRAYKNYADTHRIAPSYKIISKKDHLSQEKYLSLLDTIPKI